MDCLFQSRFVRKLSFLDSSSHQWVINYLEVLESRHCAEGTLEATIGAIKRFLQYLPTNRQSLIKSDFAQITSHDLDCFIANTTSKGFAPSTINNTISILKDFFAYLIDNEQMLRQPVNRHRHHLFAPTTLPKPMAEADLIEFFKVIDSIRDRLLFLLMLRCGLRVSETCALKWEDIDQLQQTLRVNNGKGEVDRIAYLSPDVERSLKLWKSRNSKSVYLFPSRKVRSSHITRKEAYHLMMKYLKLASITRAYSPHCLRHTFATQLLNAGVGLEVLKELMGHRSIQVTLRYTELYDSTKRQQYDTAMQHIEKRQVGVGRGGK